MQNARKIALISAALALASCAKPEHASSGFSSGASIEASPSAVRLGDAAEHDEGTSDDAGSTLAWADAIRAEKWDDAWHGLEALGDPEKTQPEIRYARARVALARGDADGAGKLLDGLETSLPLLSDDIARYRAEARLVTGPFDAAGEWFASRPSLAAQLKAARAFVKAKDPRARVATDRIILGERRTRLQEAEARAIRAGLGAPDASVAADARWIRVRAPDTAFDHDAEATLAKADPSHPLTADEWMIRAHALADAGRANDAIAAIDRAGSLAHPPSGVDRMRAKANALFQAKGRYGEAWSAFTQASQLGGPHAADDAFMAARSLARADRDDEAIRDYEAIERRFPKTTWADQGAFHAARLHFLHARWREAAAGFDGYLKRYPGGAERKDATRSLAVSRLMAGENKTARRLFGQIADDDEGLGGTRAANMEALAASKDGDRTHAVARWTEVARARPLSWPALVARTRLVEAGAPIPPTVDGDLTEPAAPPIAVKLPPPVDMLHRIGLDGDAEEALVAREAVITQAAAGRGIEALCAAYGQLGRARRRYQLALQIPAALLARAPSARTRWAWECAYPTPHEGIVRAVDASEPMPEGLVYAVMRQESNFDPDVVSPARAVGLMQLLPETAKTVADDARIPHDDARLTSPAQNITLGAKYLHDLLDRFHGAIPLAVAAYNAGPDTIARWISRAPTMDVDVFVEFIPFTETRIYVARVLGNLARYGYMKNGDAGVPKVPLGF